LVHVKYTGDDASEVCVALCAASGFAGAAVLKLVSDALPVS
jgi:hypothetical protein